MAQQTVHAQQLKSTETAAATAIAAAEVDCQVKLLAEIEHYRVMPPRKLGPLCLVILT